MNNQKKERKKGAPFVHHYKDPALRKMKRGIALTTLLWQIIYRACEANPREFPNPGVYIEKKLWFLHQNSPSETLMALEKNKEEGAVLEQRLKNIKVRKEILREDH